MKNHSSEFNFTILMIVLILITLIAGAGLAFKEHFMPSLPEKPAVESALTKNARAVSERIYKYKGTRYRDIDKINSLVETLDYIGFRFVSAEQSENEDNLITINYKADSRSKYRIMSDYSKNFYQTSITLFALVDDLSGVRISVSDDYGEFSSFHCRRDMLHEENTYTIAYTSAYLKNASRDEETFVDFIEGLLVLNIPVDGKSYERKIYKMLPPQLELVEGSVTEISSTISKKDAELLESLGADMTSCTNRPCEIKLYSVNDYIKNEISPYVFIFADGELMTFVKLENDSQKTDIITALS